MVTIVGIDSSKDKVDAVALSDHLIVDHFTVDWSHRPPPRGSSLKQIRIVFTDWLEQLEDPVLYIEEPIVMRSRRVAIWMAETVGMLLAIPYPAFLVPIDVWKRVLVGHGGVGKEAVQQAVIRRYPHSENLLGLRQDLFDACGVAVFGDQDQEFRAGLGVLPLHDPA